MGLKYFLVALALAAVSPTGAQTASAPVLVRGPDPAIWQGGEPAGAIVHRATGVSLPAELDGFKREEVTALSADDVFVRYRNVDGTTETVVSVYLFKPGALPEHKLKGAMMSFAELNPTAFVWSSGPFEIPAATRLHGYKGSYKTGIGPDTVMDHLYFAALGRWTVKVRATMAGTKDPAQEARIDSFVRDLPWAQILGANGECTGRACSAPAFDEFSYHVMETMLGPLVASKMEVKPKDEARLPVVGTADAALFGKAEIRRSDAGELVYVATVPRFQTYRLIRLPDAIRPLFTDGFGRMSIDKPVYALVIKMDKVGLMPRLYNGEPTPEAFGRAIGELAMNEMPGPFVSVKTLAERLPD